MTNLYVILPCYNEEQGITALLDEWYSHRDALLEQYRVNLKVACVDDGSADSTASKIIDAKEEYDTLTLLSHEQNKGLGMAVKTGLDYFYNTADSGDFAVIMDADNTHDPKYVYSMLDKVESGEEGCIIASRYREGSEIHGVTFFRNVLSFGARGIFSLFLRVPGVKEYTCGYRLYTYNAIKAVKDRFGEDYIAQTGFSCMAELLYKLHLSGVKFSEVPFALRYDLKQGDSKIRVFKTAVSSLKLVHELRTENESKSLLKIYLPYLIMFLVSYVLLLMSCTSPYYFLYPKWDSAVFLHVSKMWNMGYIPYLEVWDNKGPVLYFINMVAYRFLGDNGPWYIEILFFFLTAAFTYKALLNLKFNKAAAVCAACFLLVATTFLFIAGMSCEQYGVAFSMMAIYIATCAFSEDRFFTPRETFMLGVTCASVLLIRVNMTSVWCVLILFASVYLFCYSHITLLLRHAGIFLAGIMTVALPFIIYFTYHNAMDDLIFATLTSSSALMQKGGLLKTIISGVKNFLGLACGAYIIVLLYFPSAFSVAVYKEKGKRLKELAIPLFVLALLIVNIIANSVSGHVMGHYSIIFLPVAAIPMGYFLHFMGSGSKDGGFDIRAKQASTAIFITLMLIIFNRHSIYHDNNQNWLYDVVVNNVEFSLKDKDDRYGKGRNELADYIVNHTTEDDTIATLGFEPHINYLTNRLSASKYFYLLTNHAMKDDVMEEMVNETIHDIDEKRPAIIVEYKETRDKCLNDRWAKFEGTARYNKLIKSDYVFTETFFDQATVYLRKDLAE